MFREELLAIVNTWTIEKLDEYIKQLEYRVEDTQQLLRELRALRRKWSRIKKNLDTGTRGGK